MFPETEISLAILFGLLIVPLFYLLGRLGAYFAPPMRRLKIASTLALIVWFISCLLWVEQMQFNLLIHPNMLAGLAILISATIGAFLVISLLSWGFTVTMLLDLNGLGEREKSREEWKAQYGNKMGFDYFVSDRISLLNRLGISQVYAENLKLTPRGKVITTISFFLLWYFNVDRFEKKSGSL